MTLRLIVISVWTVALLGIVAWAVTAMFMGQPPDSITINNNNYSSDMHFAKYDVIVNQYQEIHGKSVPDELALDLRKAVNLLKGGDYGEALSAFRTVSDKIDVPAVHNNVGGLYALASNPNAARQEYQKAVALDPDYEPVQLNLGLLEESAGNYEEAERHLGKAISYSDARKLVRTMVNRREAGLIEQEPNGDRDFKIIVVFTVRHRRLNHLVQRRHIWLEAIVVWFLFDCTGFSSVDHRSYEFSGVRIRHGAIEQELNDQYRWIKCSLT